MAAILVAITSVEPLVDALFPELVGNVLQIIPLIGLPVSLAIGLVAPHLFDIELVLSRTLAYVALWLLIGLCYVGLAAALGIAVRGQGLDIAVLVAIAATLSFDPARQWLVRRAAQWLGDAGVGSEELLRRLGQTLAHTLDIDALVRGIAATVRDGLGVEWVRIRLDDGRTVVDGPVPDAVDCSASARMRTAERDVGVIECGPRRRGLWREHQRELLTTIGGQAALALDNATLASELGDHLVELRRQSADLIESRSRLVQAEESARRRIERDLHDGVQQQLVALIAAITLARQQADGARNGTLAGLQADAEQALADLRELVSGIHPSVLGDRGLVGAIRSRVARLPLGVTVAAADDVGDRRFSEVVEGTSYFFACEALTNAVKHADATHIAVRLDVDGGLLTVEVADDGRGFDVDAVHSSGLGGLMDRLAAVGGQLVIESSPRAGTRVTARLPADARAAS